MLDGCADIGGAGYVALYSKCVPDAEEGGYLIEGASWCNHHGGQHGAALSSASITQDPLRICFIWVGLPSTRRRTLQCGIE